MFRSKSFDGSVGENVRLVLNGLSTKSENDGRSPTNKSTLKGSKDINHKKENYTVGMRIKDGHPLLPKKVRFLVQSDGLGGDENENNATPPMKLDVGRNLTKDPILNSLKDDVIGLLGSQKNDGATDENIHNGKG
mmetsp:Transcript_20514/g.28864  ORF Transcript_20514/g.28864 Transcript_20514/m.28864 type:complete len:135 (-) Transcript_20514:106-510(-)|eukprot:CAMPEP_0184860456 /NCGR_PEP_ID=MMETSP0580-20130426/5349_1 /TAXON_ID=1118495 /ORGANISM="Dactyliosolen fragilissimus" /LENGTH=134 /DNA_ID=CAMNT_0027357573 /DNA_START=91 /DNA_END=495 /DNA_ORIENTATION=-